MPSYKGQLSPDDLFCIVEYLKTVSDFTPGNDLVSDAGKSDKKTHYAGTDRGPADLAALSAKLKQAVQEGTMSEEDAMAKYEAAANATKGKKK